jgi:hypothetical protein
MAWDTLPATLTGLRDRTCSRCGDPVIPGRHRAFVHRPSSHAYDHEAVPASRGTAGGAPPVSRRTSGRSTRFVPDPLRAAN